jgi:hypothetical protein
MNTDIIVIDSVDVAIPPGGYTATLTAIEPVDTPNAKFAKEGYRWTWTVASGKLTGQTVTGITDRANPRNTNKLGQWLSALTGKPLSAGMAITLAEYVGRTYLVTVTGDRGNVASFAAIAD